VSSADDYTQKAGQLIERLLADAHFRAEFRKDPAGACRALGLADLATELGEGGKAMHTMEVRESKSSLAGVVMAVAAEGIGVVELHGLVQHGLLKGNLGAAGERALRGVNPLHPASSLHSELRAENPLSGGSRNPVGAAERAAALAHEAGQGASPGASGAAPGAGAPGGAAAGTAAPGGAGTAAPGGAGASAAPGGAASTSAAASAPGGAPGASTPGGAVAGTATPGAAAAASPGAPASGGSIESGSGGSSWGPSPPSGAAAAANAGEAPAVGAPAAPVPAHGAPEVAPAGTPAPSQPVGGGGVQTGGGAGTPVPPPTPPAPGAQPAAGGAVPVWPEPAQTPAGGGAAAAQVADLAGQAPALPTTGTGSPGLAELLNSPHLALPPDVRTIFAQGNVDPRIVSVLDSAVAHHNIVIGDIETTTEPVHAQAIDIVSVDGQPVGPGNVAARDLITEIAAMEPGVRPSEIGTPWPIQSQGFFTDAQHENRLHLAFTSVGDYQAPPAGAQAMAAVSPGAPGAVESVAGSPGAPGAVDPAAGATTAAPGAAAFSASPGAGADSPAFSASPGAGAASPAVSASPGGGAVSPAVSASPDGAVYATPVPAAEAFAAPPARTESGAAVALAWAHSMLHKLPESEGENVGPALNRFEGAFGFHGAPWCGIFVGHALEHAGLKVPDSIASVASILEMAKNGEGPFEKGILPIGAVRPGDLVTFGGTEHVAMVVKVDGEGIHTIAGNYENNVTEHTYSPGEVTGAVRPRYAAMLPQVQAPGGAPSGVAAADGAPGGASSPSVVPPAAAAPDAAAVPGGAPGAGVAAAGSPAPGAGAAVASGAEAPGGAQIAGAPPAQSGTGVFSAAAPHASGASLHTVKFLQAVQPSSSSAPQVQAAVDPAGAQPAGVSTAVGAPGSGSGAEAVPGTGSAADTAPGPGGAAEVAPGTGSGADAVAGATDLASGTIPYPGDNAPKADIAQWMGDIAQKHGLPRELPVMAALVESSLHNDSFGDRDSLGYFQMRTSVWDNGQYAGYPHDPALQLKWFIDQALAVKSQMADRHFGSDPSNYGEWIDEIERPAEEYRGRYQLQLGSARELLGGG
jgi:hypothetical protein